MRQNLWSSQQAEWSNTGLIVLIHSAVSHQEILVDALELIDDGEPTKVALVLIKDFRRNIFY